ncbi:MAG: glycosyltransferase family 4 protein [Alphaproteobacteria bacterium]|nr:glycosyltransferase family 4 protein [Alphaproteobacteria bacterium]
MPTDRQADQIVIIDDMSQARGGATVLALLSARLLHGHGYKVVYVTGDQGENAELEKLGIEILATKGSRLLDQPALKSAMQGLYNKDIATLLRHFILARDTPNTVYHLHGWAQTLSPSVFAPLRKVAARTHIHCHDLFLACPNAVFFDFQKSEDCQRKPLGLSCLITNCDKRSYAQKIWRVGRQFMLRALFDQKKPWAAIAIIHPNMTAPLELSGYPRDRLVTIRNPASPYTSHRIKAEENHKFAFVGRLEPDKGVVDFLKAVQETGALAVVVGDGPLRAELEKGHPTAHFTGWTAPKDIGAAVDTCRALVMPSRFREPFGLVAVEASLSGLPIILSKNAFLAREMVENGLGYSCNTRNSADFAKTLAKVHNEDAERIRAISIHAYSGEAHLAQSEQEWADQLRSLYSTTLDRGVE